MIVCCVWTGNTKFKRFHVERLFAGVRRHLDVPFRFVCLTDQPDVIDGVESVRVDSFGLRGWFAKMALFDPSWRNGDGVVYLDLDTVVVGDLLPLVTVQAPFGICANFARLHGSVHWPCQYGSAVMTMEPGFGRSIWDRFWANRFVLMRENHRYGDQRVIEILYPKATLLQHVLPTDFMITYRELREQDQGRNRNASLVIFGGSNKPDNCTAGWVRDLWLGRVRHEAGARHLAAGI